MKFIPNLRFGGQAEEALKLYQKVFHCKIHHLMHYMEADPADNDISILSREQQQNCIYHCELEMEGMRIMLCDDLFNPPKSGEMLSFNVIFDDVPAAQSAYDAMVEAGSVVQVSAHEATFAPFVSSVIDPFGIRWGLMVEK